MKLPTRIYVQQDEDSTVSEPENLLAWRKLASSDPGKVGIYQLVEVVETREVVQLRRGGGAWTTED